METRERGGGARKHAGEIEALRLGMVGLANVSLRPVL